MLMTKRYDIDYTNEIKYPKVLSEFGFSDKKTIIRIFFAISEIKNTFFFTFYTFFIRTKKIFIRIDFG